MKEIIKQSKPALLIATFNQGKIRELKEMLGGLPLTVKGLADFPNVSEVEETGATFAENSVLKARSYAAQSGIMALGDDSGLEIEALNNAPGIYSARFAGENATDADKTKKILDELADTPLNRRAARFICHAAIADQHGQIICQAQGICKGNIALRPAGENGFGYDPIFIPAGFDQTFGQLSSEIKRKISHRAQALEKIIRFLGDFIAL